MSIQSKVNKLKEDLKNKAVTLIAVTKYASIEQMLEAYSLGIRDFGESKVQVFEDKIKDIPEAIFKEIRWHFIGHLQTNKIKKVVGNFDIIHSVDTPKLLEAISKESRKKNITQKVLLEVNISKEESKYGFTKEEILKQFSELAKLSNIDIIGLMTMAPYTEDKAIKQKVFKELRELKEQLSNNYTLTELSMGMSEDYLVAVEEGSTMVRIGKMLFA